MWNGTADTLNTNPTISSTIATMSIGLPVIDCEAISAPIRSRRVLPTTP